MILQQIQSGRMVNDRLLNTHWGELEQALHTVVHAHMYVCSRVVIGKDPRLLKTHQCVGVVKVTNLHRTATSM